VKYWVLGSYAALLAALAGCELTGKTTLRFLLQILIEHDIEHLNQIVQLQQAARSIPVRDAQPAVENRNESNKTE
jgi:hypothetical protein